MSIWDFPFVIFTWFTFKFRLANGVSPNDENKTGFTPVHLAAKCGHADVFDLFARTGISLKQPSSKIGMTALHIGKNLFFLKVFVIFPYF